MVWISRDSLMEKLADFGGLGGVSHYGWRRNKDLADSGIRGGGRWMGVGQR